MLNDNTYRLLTLAVPKKSDCAVARNEVTRQPECNQNSSEAQHHSTAKHRAAKRIFMYINENIYTLYMYSIYIYVETGSMYIYT